MLRQASVRVSFHMPAIGGRALFKGFHPHRWDTTELATTDDLYHPRGSLGPIASAQGMAAASAGAAHTLMLPGGGTAGIHTMLLYAAKRGETVVLPRNCHASTLHICAVAGLEPVFTSTSYTSHGRAYTEAEAYKDVMERHPHAKAVLVVRPDYYGLMTDLQTIAREAHRKGLLVLCDEAHGATFNWRRDVLNAISLGADLAVQSAHKTLPVLTPGAWLHGCSSIDIQRLRNILRLVQTSSPSFITMLSLDEARAWMNAHGERACVRLKKALLRFYAAAERLGYSPGQDDTPPGLSYDPLRLVLQAYNRNSGGLALEETLRQQGIDMEMADDGCIVGILPLRGSKARLSALLKALQRIKRPGQGGQDQPLPLLKTPPPIVPRRVLSLGEATFSASEPIPVAQAVGRVSATNVGRYPPGTAFLIAGEELAPDMAAFLANQDLSRMFGLTDQGDLPCVCGIKA